MMSYGDKSSYQCDQMVIEFVQFLAIYNNENMPNTVDFLHEYT